MILLTASSASCVVAHAGERRRVLHRADADDRALAGHQARHRVHGADAARVGQRDRGAGVVVHGQLVAPGPPDDVLVGLPELPEVHRLGVLDARHDQRARAVRLGQVDRDAEVDVLGRDQDRLAVDLGERVVHLRVRGQRLDQRVPDEVGEADLAAAAAGQVVVDHDAVVGEQLGRDGAHAGRGRAPRATRPCSARSWRRRRGSAWWCAPAGAAGGRLRRPWPRAAAAGAGPARRRPERRRPGRRRPERRRRAGAARRPVRAAAGGGGRSRRGRCAAPAVPATAARRPACSRRRSRARPGRRSPGRRGTAGTSRRRSTRWDRSPPVGCPAKSAESTQPLSSLHACAQPRKARLPECQLRLRVDTTPGRIGVARC